MFCGNCGAKLDPNSKFCPECGCKVSETKQISNSVASSSEADFHLRCLKDREKFQGKKSK